MGTEERVWWNSFHEAWADIGIVACSDLAEVEYDPPLPEDVISGKVALKHVFGRSDLGDYRNPIKNVYGMEVGVVAHVKRAVNDRGQFENILTIEDIGGECPVINIVTSAGKKITVNVGRFGFGDVEVKKLEFQ